MSQPLLEVDNLHVHFDIYGGTAEVINGIDLTVDAGETAALVGESGCGKSVTARTILGLLQEPPGSVPEGSIRYKGTELLDLSDRERYALLGSEMSMILQDPMTALNPVYTVGEQMRDIMKWQGKTRVGITDWIRDKFSRDTKLRERAIQMLETVQISAPERVYSSYPVELSGGMRQRVLIAMALLTDPDFLIADEPGTAIDVTTEAKILELLDDLVEETGTGILYITHDLGVAMEVSESINVMYAGEIVEQAPTEKLFDTAEHPYTRGLLDSIPKLSEQMGPGIEGRLPDYTNPPLGCRFADRCPHAEDECYEMFPYRRIIDPGHSVACHLHDGEPTEQRHTDLAESDSVNIGTAPWHGDNATPDGGSNL